MTLVMHNVPLGQSHYDTCYAQCATGTVIMSLVMDNVLQGQTQYSTHYSQRAIGTESL